MEDCHLKWIIVVVCIILVLAGLYLSFIRERKNIETGNADIMDGGGNLKEGSFSFKFAIGLVLIGIGVAGAFFSIRDLPGCNVSSSEKIKPVSDSIPTFSFNCGDRNINSDFEKKLLQDGFHLSSDNPDFTITILSELPGEPQHRLINRDFVYFYDSTEMQLRINEFSFGIGTYILNTMPKPHIPEAKAEYRKNYLSCLQQNFDKIYYALKQNLHD